MPLQRGFGASKQKFRLETVHYRHKVMLELPQLLPPTSRRDEDTQSLI